jgi:hypothetical protein
MVSTNSYSSNYSQDETSSLDSSKASVDASIVVNSLGIFVFTIIGCLNTISLIQRRIKERSRDKLGIHRWSEASITSGIFLLSELSAIILYSITVTAFIRHPMFYDVCQMIAKFQGMFYILNKSCTYSCLWFRAFVVHKALHLHDWKLVYLRNIVLFSATVGIHTALLYVYIDVFSGEVNIPLDVCVFHVNPPLTLYLLAVADVTMSGALLYMFIAPLRQHLRTIERLHGVGGGGAVGSSSSGGVEGVGNNVLSNKMNTSSPRQIANNKHQSSTPQSRAMDKLIRSNLIISISLTSLVLISLSIMGVMHGLSDNNSRDEELRLWGQFSANFESIITSLILHLLSSVWVPVGIKNWLKNKGFTHVSNSNSRVVEPNTATTNNNKDGPGQQQVPTNFTHKSSHLNNNTAQVMVAGGTIVGTLVDGEG